MKSNIFAFPTLKAKCIGVLIIVLLLCCMNTTLSYIVFSIHFDTHLVECQQHRHHDDNCQATCILEEMLVDQASDDTILGYGESIICCFPALFLEPLGSLKTSIDNYMIQVQHLTLYLSHYVSPTLRQLAHPPENHP